MIPSEMLIFKPGDLSPDQVLQYLDSIERFKILGVGTDREILSDCLVKHVISADDSLKELNYFRKILNDLKFVLKSQIEALESIKK